VQLDSLAGIFLLAIPIAYYLIYNGVVQFLSNRRTENERTDPKFAPPVSIVIPTYNERRTIEERVKNLDSLEYARDQIEAIFVDGASTDGTPEVIEGLISEGRPFIRLIRQATRQGYNAAMYEGICAAKEKIIIMGEAGSFFAPSALSRVVRHLADPAIGAVTGKSVLFNPDSTFATRLETAYRRGHDQLRLAESRLDSTPDMKGELLAVRREIVLKLRPHVTLPDNTEIGMATSYMTRAQRLRAIFDPEAIFYEYAPTTLSDRVKVQIRRATTFTGAVWNFRHMVLNRKYGIFGLLIAPSRVLMLIVFPWLMILWPFIMLWQSLSQPIVGIGCLAIVLLALVGSRARYLVLSFALSQIILAIATLRLLFKRHSQIIHTVPTARR
jgi:cellulose synthase/poly-beta-1,6-N-acetylglucosamine synthase-like glycosyltransferase